MNPLGFHFWYAAQYEVHGQKPQSFEELVRYVQVFERAVDQGTI